MIKFNNKTVYQWNYDASEALKMYYNNSVIFLGIEHDTPTPPTPSVKYAVVDDISTYEATTYIDVYNKADDSWYKRNNLNEYEIYGEYGESTGSSATYYDGKLAVVDGYEYKHTNGSWNNIGEGRKENVPMTTGFSASQAIETVRLDISGSTSTTSLYLSVTPNDTATRSNYYIQMRGRSARIYYPNNGNTVTAYVTGQTLVSGTTYEFTFPTPMYMLSGYSYTERQASAMTAMISAYSESLQEEYVDKRQPDFYVLYDTVEDMEADTDVYDGKYSQIGSTIYKYNETNNAWGVTADKLMTGRTVSDIPSFNFVLDNNYSNLAKCYVNGNSTNGIHNWVYHNDDAVSGVYFTEGNNVNSDIGMVDFDWLTLDISQLTCKNLINGKFTHLEEVHIPSNVTVFGTSFDCVNINSSPLRPKIYVHASGQTSGYLEPQGCDVYLVNGAKLSKAPDETCRYYVPSSAVTSYRSDSVMQTYIPFMHLLDNDVNADLTYGYYIQDYNITSSNLKVIFSLLADNFSKESWYNTDSSLTSIRLIKIGQKIRTIADSSLKGLSKAYIDTSDAVNLATIGVSGLATSSNALEITGKFKAINYAKTTNLSRGETDKLWLYNITTVGYQGCYSYFKTSYDIEIGDSCKEIGMEAFKTSGIAYTKPSITCRAIVPPKISANSTVFFSSVNDVAAIYVPSESVEAYKAADGWNTYASVIQAIEDE